MIYILLTIIILFALVCFSFYIPKRRENKLIKRQEEEIMKAAKLTRVVSYPYIIKTTKYSQGGFDKSECTINGIPFTEFDKVIISWKDNKGSVSLIESGEEWKLMDHYGMAIPIDDNVKTIRRQLGV